MRLPHAVDELYTVRTALDPVVDEFGCDPRTGEQVRVSSWEQQHPASACDGRCEVCGQPSTGVWCARCVEWQEQCAPRVDPLAGVALDLDAEPID